MNKMRVHSWNANSIRNKKYNTIDFLDKHQVDVMLIKKTKLPVKDLLKFEGYFMVKRNKDNVAKGVVILVMNTFAYKPVKIIRTTSIKT